MNIRPILDRIIIKLQEPEQETSTGILIANAKNEGIVQAEILAVGPGTYNDDGKFIKVSVEVGNNILVHTQGGLSFEHDEEEYFAITENEIVAVLS